MGRLSIPDSITGCFLNNPPKASSQEFCLLTMTYQKFCSVSGGNLIKHIFSSRTMWGVSFFIMPPSLFASFSAFLEGHFVDGEVPMWVGSPEGGLYEDVPKWWRKHEYGNLHVCKNLFFFFLPFFPSCLFWFFLNCPFPPCVFEFSWSVPSKNLSIGNMRT